MLQLLRTKKVSSIILQLLEKLLKPRNNPTYIKAIRVVRAISLYLAFFFLIHGISDSSYCVLRAAHTCMQYKEITRQ